MKVYIDVVILVNTLYDALILSSVSILLKKHISIKRILLGCLIGSTSILFLFIKINNIFLFLYKVIISFVMNKITFRDRDIINEIYYFFIITVIIGGSQILISGSYYKINIVTMLIISPLIIYMFIKSNKEYRLRINKIYTVILINNNKTIKLNGFIDTGNTLKDTITKLPVIIVNKDYKLISNKKYLIPCNTINGKSIIEAYKLDSVIVDNKIVDVLVSYIDKKYLNKYDVILNDNIREIIYD